MFSLHGYAGVMQELAHDFLPGCHARICGLNSASLVWVWGGDAQSSFSTAYFFTVVLAAARPRCASCLCQPRASPSLFVAHRRTAPTHRTAPHSSPRRALPAQARTQPMVSLCALRARTREAMPPPAIPPLSAHPPARAHASPPQAICRQPNFVKKGKFWILDIS